MANSFSRPNQIVGSEWMLHRQVFASLQKRWSVTVDLFATSLNHRLPVYFAPMSDPMAAGTDAMLQNWDHFEAYAFPPVAMSRQVLNKIRNSVGTRATLIAPLWPSKEWFPDLLFLLTEPATFASTVGSAPSAPCSEVSPAPVMASSSCVETLQRFARAAGFSSHVTRQLGRLRRVSALNVYQSKWSVYRHWCREKRHSISSPSIPKVADFFYCGSGDLRDFLWRRLKHIALCFQLFFSFKLPAISTDSALKNLIRSFAVECPRGPTAHPLWDMDVVLRHLSPSAYEPLQSRALRTITKKVLFLVSSHC